MSDFVDTQLHEEQKEERTKQIRDENTSGLQKTKRQIDAELEILLQEEQGRRFDLKDLKHFRNNQRKFQYDYEEDFYEPDYEEDEF